MPEPIPPPIDPATLTLIRLAVDEDIAGPHTGGGGDKTVELAVPAELVTTGRIVARAPGVIAGTYLLPAILSAYAGGADLHCRVLMGDGTRVARDDGVAEFSGSTRTLLSAERVMLNFLGHLSGVATLTRRYVDAVVPVAEKNGGRPVICDTRKTTPAFRALDKYAVRCGGGVNHRMGLYDGVMLKDNHLAALHMGAADQSLASLTGHIRATLDRRITLWLEVDTPDQLREALGGPGDRQGADIILLDNFTPAQMREAVHLRDAAGSKILLEASGGITLDNVRAAAETGVDRISIGALTHSAPILDLSMEFQT